MSAPNKSYDPVGVSALSDDAVAAAQAAALAAIAGAASPRPLPSAGAAGAGSPVESALVALHPVDEPRKRPCPPPTRPMTRSR